MNVTVHRLKEGTTNCTNKKKKGNSLAKWSRIAAKNTRNYKKTFLATDETQIKYGQIKSIAAVKGALAPLLFIRVPSVFHLWFFKKRKRLIRLRPSVSVFFRGDCTSDGWAVTKIESLVARIQGKGSEMFSFLLPQLLLFLAIQKRKLLPRCWQRSFDL